MKAFDDDGAGDGSDEESHIGGNGPEEDGPDASTGVEHVFVAAAADGVGDGTEEAPEDAADDDGG